MEDLTNIKERYDIAKYNHQYWSYIQLQLANAARLLDYRCFQVCPASLRSLYIAESMIQID